MQGAKIHVSNTMYLKGEQTCAQQSLNFLPHAYVVPVNR
ncbi:MAG: hypothetical protein ACI84R_003511, partial [Candidatus Azotimanducaceae bacterium]